MKYLLLITLLSGLAAGCKLILLKSEGIKQPALENHSSLCKFLLSNDIDTSEILCFRDTQALNDFYKLDVSLPDSRFFNREKFMVDYRTAPNDCNGKVAEFIEKADSVNQKPPLKTQRLADYLKDVIEARTGQPFVLDKLDYDVYLVVYWAKYLGKVNKHKVFEWQKLVDQAKTNGQKIRMILIDADYQSSWGIKRDQVPTFDY